MKTNPLTLHPPSVKDRLKQLINSLFSNSSIWDSQDSSPNYCLTKAMEPRASTAEAPLSILLDSRTIWDNNNSSSHLNSNLSSPNNRTIGTNSSSNNNSNNPHSIKDKALKETTHLMDREVTLECTHLTKEVIQEDLISHLIIQMALIHLKILR